MPVALRHALSLRCHCMQLTVGLCVAWACCRQHKQAARHSQGRHAAPTHLQLTTTSYGATSCPTTPSPPSGTAATLMRGFMADSVRAAAAATLRGWSGAGRGCNIRGGRQATHGTLLPSWCRTGMLDPRHFQNRHTQQALLSRVVLRYGHSRKLRCPTTPSDWRPCNDASKPPIDSADSGR